MAKTYNRSPLNFPASGLNEKYYNLADFKGLCTNNNVVTIDQDTFREAVNVYRDDNDQLSTRPPLVVKPVEVSIGSEFVLSKIIKINNIEFYVYYQPQGTEGCVCFNTKSGTVSINVDNNPSNVNIIYDNDIYILFSQSTSPTLRKIVGLDISFSGPVVKQIDIADVIYTPVTKTASGNTITDNEEKNIFIKNEIWRYLFTSEITTDTSNLYYKDVTVHIDNETFNVNFVPGNELVFTEEVAMSSSSVNYKSLVVARNGMGIARKLNSINEFYFTPDCINYYSLPVPDMTGFNIFTISEDGLMIYIIDLGKHSSGNNDAYGLIYYANVSISDPSAIPTITFNNVRYNYYPKGYDCNVHLSNQMYSTRFTTLTNYIMTPSDSRCHSPEAGQLIFTYSYSLTYSTGQVEGGTSFVYGTKYSGDYPFTSVWLFDNTKASNKVSNYLVIQPRVYNHLFNISYTKTNDSFNYATFTYYVNSDKSLYVRHMAFNNSGIPYVTFVCLGNLAYKDYFFEEAASDINIYYDEYITAQKATYTDGEYAVGAAWVNNDTTSHYIIRLLKASGKFHLISDYSAQYYTDTFTYRYIGNTSPWYTGYGTRESYPVLNQSDRSGMIQSYTDAFTLSDAPNKIVMYSPTIFLTGHELYINNHDIKLLNREGDEKVPLYCTDKTIVYIDTVNQYRIYSNVYTPGKVYADLLISTDNPYTYLVPQFSGYLDSSVFSIDNKLYITSRTLAGKQLYVKESNVILLVDDVTGIVNFSTLSLGLFFENEVYELQLTDNGYKLAKTKLQLGCKRGADVILTYDGANILLTTLKGLNVLTYQDFVQSTDQVLSYLTENIISDYDKFNTAPIKLYQYKNWIFMYKTNSPDILVYDLRNKSWWFWTSRHNVEQMLYFDDVLCILSKGVIYYYDKTNSLAYDGVAEPIYWKIVSQKLHFGVPNNYKHIRNFTILSSTDDEGIGKLQCKLTFKNYHNIQQFTTNDVVEYKVNQLSTYIEKVNFMKTNAFQFTIESNKYNDPIRFLTPNIAIKYRVTERIR